MDFVRFIQKAYLFVDDVVAVCCHCLSTKVTSKLQMASK